MAIEVTARQVLALAPDDASAKAARPLATPKPWSQLGQDGRAAWGACQGSGKDPYLTRVDWEGPAFKCSCPSRKFPCKHGLALLLLLAEKPALFPQAGAPEWVKTWIASRQQRSEAKESREAAPVDEAARAKRVEQRAGRVSDGVDLLELWLRDLVQQGLSRAPDRGFDFWDQQAKRLVDAQAPGLARLVSGLGGIAGSGAGWQDRLVAAIGRLVLLIHAHRRIDALPPETQADVRAALGFTMSREEVLAGPAVTDQWLVAGQRTVQEDRLRVQRTWLSGKETGRAALLLEFTVGAAGFKSTWLPGTAVAADLCFFPGAVPLRALAKEVRGAPGKAGRPWGAQTIAESRESIGYRLAANPWIESQPVLLRDVIPVPSPGGWILTDGAGSLPCAANDALLAVSGGRPVDVAGEWDGTSVHALAVFSGGRFVAIGPEAGA